MNFRVISGAPHRGTEEKYQKFKQEYLQNLTIRIPKLKQKYDISPAEYKGFIKRISEEEGYRRSRGWPCKLIPIKE